nr:hypothetical protein [Tanacetum cinerariifolium]
MRNRDYASWDLGQMHMGRSGLGVGTVPVSCRYRRVSMGEGSVLAGKEVRGYASWDLGQMHMGRSGLGVGTVPVSCRYRRVSMGEGSVLAGKEVRGTVWVVRVWGFGTFGPWGLFKFAIRFRLLGFKILTELVLVAIVLRLWNLDKLSFIVRLFAENLLLDPAFLCGF